MAERRGWLPSARQLADLAQEVPPMVTASQIMADRTGTPAALLGWGSHLDAGWQAGIAWIYVTFRGSPLRALLTTWVPAVQVRRHAGESYARVPRVRLEGPQGGWPSPPAAYPKIDNAWLARHHYAAVADPTGEYHDLREDIRRTS